MKDFFKSVGFKALAAVALFLVGIMIYAASTGGFATIPATIVSAVVTPLQSFAAGIADGMHDFIGNFSDGGELRKQNEALQEEINELRKNQIELDETRRKLEDYKDFLELKDAHSDYKFADGKVISRDPSDKSYNFTINVGSLHDVKAGDPVITPSGLVGVVYEVTLNSAKVRTILDSATHVSAYISRSGDGGVTSGSLPLAAEGLLRIDNLSKETGATVGDYVATSGDGGIYPNGLPIGKIVSVDPDSDGLTMTANIKAFADIKNVTNVFVLTDFAQTGESGPAE